MNKERDNAQPSDIVSGEFGVELVTLDGSGLGQGADQDCREITVWPERLKLVAMGETALAAASGVILPEAPIPVPLSNTSKLFFDGTIGDVVYILWRS
jgi:hypothetical protein